MSTYVRNPFWPSVFFHREIPFMGESEYQFLPCIINHRQGEAYSVHENLLVLHPALGQSQFRGEKDIWLPDRNVRYPLADKGQDLVNREYHKVFRPLGLVLLGREMAARHACDQFRIIVLTDLCKK